MTQYIRNVVIHYIHPPIPDRRFDWRAYREGMEEGGVYGYGATEVEALAELLMLEADEAEAAAELPMLKPITTTRRKLDPSFWTLNELDQELIDR